MSSAYKTPTFESGLAAGLGVDNTWEGNEPEEHQSSLGVPDHQVDKLSESKIRNNITGDSDVVSKTSSPDVRPTRRQNGIRNRAGESEKSSSETLSAASHQTQPLQYNEDLRRDNNKKDNLKKLLFCPLPHTMKDVGHTDDLDRYRLEMINRMPAYRRRQAIRQMNRFHREKEEQKLQKEREKELARHAIFRRERLKKQGIVVLGGATASGHKTHDSANVLTSRNSTKPARGTIANGGFSSTNTDANVNDYDNGKTKKKITNENLTAAIGAGAKRPSLCIRLFRCWVVSVCITAFLLYNFEEDVLAFFSMEEVFLEG